MTKSQTRGDTLSFASLTCPNEKILSARAWGQTPGALVSALGG